MSRKPKNPKLVEFSDLVAAEDVPAEKIAEIAGVAVEEVQAERREAIVEAQDAAMAAAPASNVIPDDDDDDDPVFPPMPTSREEALARREAELARREAALAARERSVSTRRPAGRVIRVTRTFDATTPHPETGRPQSHRFVSSLFRGAMAERVMEIAAQSGNTDCIEVVSEG